MLASGSTNDARAMLLKYTGENAINTQDLANKLATMYANSTNKVDIEREFAKIHPHRDFIVKYFKETLTNQTPPPVREDVPTQPPPVAEAVVGDMDLVSADGSSGCGCKCCTNNDNYSNAEGDMPQAKRPINYTPLVVFGLVSVVAIVGMFIYSKHKRG